TQAQEPVNELEQTQTNQSENTQETLNRADETVSASEQVEQANVQNNQTNRESEPAEVNPDETIGSQIDVSA
ncbi:MAG: hypothetical protein OQK51_16305, partial [Kangiellaceae bacterium]|nr:hypothetical protein [Kangiellaceae bacterium]